MTLLETEKAAAALAERINNQGTHKEADSNANGNLNHRGSDIKYNRAGSTGCIARRRCRSIDQLGRVCEHICRSKAAQQTASRGQSSRNLDENGGNEGCGGDAVTDARVQIGQYAHSQSAESVGNLRAGHKLDTAKVVDNIASKRNDDHDGHLSPFSLVQDADANDEEWDKDESQLGSQRILAGDVGRGILIEKSPKGGSNSNAESEKKGVDDGVDNSNGSWDNGSGL